MSKLQVRLSQILQRLTTERLGAKDFLGSAKSGHTAVGSILKVESSLSLSRSKDLLLRRCIFWDKNLKAEKQLFIDNDARTLEKFIAWGKYYKESVSNIQKVRERERELIEKHQSKSKWQIHHIIFFGKNISFKKKLF